MLAEFLQINHRAQAPTDKPLYFLSPARLLALGRFALPTRMCCSRQHRIFSRNPAFTLAAHPRRKAVLDAGGDQHAGVAKADQHAAFGMFGEAGFDGECAHFVWRAS